MITIKSQFLQVQKLFRGEKDTQDVDKHIKNDNTHRQEKAHGCTHTNPRDTHGFSAPQGAVRMQGWMEGE